MPPKKNRAPATIQTKLSFKPVSATKAPSLFTMETSEPLRQHMSILNKDTNNHSSSRTNGSNVVSKSSATITTTTSLMSSASYTKENSFSRQADANDSKSNSSSRVIPTMHEIGGNGVSNNNGASMSGGRTSPDTFSTKDLASSIPTSADTTATPPSWSLSSNGEANTPDRDSQGSDGHQSTRHSSTERPLKRQAGSELHGSKTSPVALDSDEDDDSNKFGARKSSQSTNKVTGTSLLDQMATPRGTQPLPRSIAPLPGYEGALKKAKLNEGLSVNRPILISSHSTVSDDGFASASSSLDNRLRGLEGNRAPDMSPPRFRSSSQSRTALPSNVPPYSQKRSGDFASLSKGGTGLTSSGAVRSRTMPPTVSGYKPMAAVAPAYSRSSSVAMSQELGSTRSRSSSPAAHTPTVAVRASTPTAYQNMSGDKTKDGMRLSEEQRRASQCCCAS
ncbi:hypothetical protein K457DRAFT_266727 [Linnemannia elongata AG-77]|uniref:Uncharacterized protein n=1 Tax=Linnemannia elongata AG-77 TaxID=1314771 RepID=A0A197JCN4_9FUNG|nr:hypothetical protein K457DRAFT_266727 [Linnemannia elongata AG-77]